MKAAQHRRDSASKQAEALLRAAFEKWQQVGQKQEGSTSPDEGNKDAESTVRGLCNSKPALQEAQERDERNSLPAFLMIDTIHN